MRQLLVVDFMSNMKYKPQPYGKSTWDINPIFPQKLGWVRLSGLFGTGFPTIGA